MLSGLKCPTNLRRLADAAVAVLLAPLCAACERPLEYPTHGAVCDACWMAATPFTPLGRDSFPPAIDLAAAVGPYEGRLRDIIHALKYDRRPTIARRLAERMRDAGADVLAGADCAVPVPLHRSRQHERGFNQARELARHLGLPVLEALVRTRRTAAQADLPAARRHTNVRGAFACRGVQREGHGLHGIHRITGHGIHGLHRIMGHGIHGLHGITGHGIHGIHGQILVLVDDVATTGATLNACAKVLLDAGAAEVRALVAARAALKTASTPR